MRKQAARRSILSKVERLIGVVTLLLRDKKTTVAALADKFEVSYRTMYRDIEAISQAGIPLIITQGYQGGVEIAPHYLLDTSLLTEEEIRLILVGLRSLQSVSDDSGTHNVLNRLTLNKEVFESRDEAILIDLSNFNSDHLRIKFSLINQSISKNLQLKFTYHSEKGAKERHVNPYHLVFKWSAWYLYSFCIDSQDYRLFKLNRMTDVRHTKTNFSPVVRKKAPDFSSYFDQETIQLQALFDLSTRYQLIEEYGIESTLTIVNGKIFFERAFTNLDYLIRWVLSFGEKVEVIKPIELIEEIRKQATLILKKYEEYDK